MYATDRLTSDRQNVRRAPSLNVSALWGRGHSHKTHTTCIYMFVIMNRCGHLYTNIPYSKHCLHWIQINQLSLTVTVSLRVSFSSCQFLMRNATHWPRIKMSSATHRRPYKCVISLPYCAKMRSTRTENPVCDVFSTRILFLWISFIMFHAL